MAPDSLPLPASCPPLRRAHGSRLWTLLALVLPLACLTASLHAAPTNSPSLDDGWKNPPPAGRLHAYWWWLNGNVDDDAITRDLEEMKAKGFGGALLCDADGSSQDGNGRAPRGPTFLSPEWRDLYRHALREADRLGLQISLNIQSGWNLGGPCVKAEDAAKKLVWSESVVTAPGPVTIPAVPKHRDGVYRDIVLLAFPRTQAPPNQPPIAAWREKAMHKTLHFSAPDTTPLLHDVDPVPGETAIPAEKVLDLTAKLRPDGTLDWTTPAGAWQLLRIGWTVGDHARVSTCSQGWEGYALDVLDAGAFTRYWDAVVAPLIDDAGPLAGRTLTHLHTDSWEVEAVNWTPTLAAEFQKRRGYPLLPWMPVLTGRIVGDRERSNRFLHDFRRTLGDLAVDHHFRPFRDLAARHGLRIHPESGGPHAVPIDAQRCLGMNDIPMSEFWAWSWRHRVGDASRFFVKQPASAAHTYGRRLVSAEGFTTIGPHWQETLWDNLKPSFDYAICEGLNRLVWHAFVCSPASQGVPGQQYFAGTHLNPLVTWWPVSAPFFLYLNRCQWLMQQGLPVADVVHYYGDHVPNFSQLRSSDPARVGPGRDYDVITEEALLERLEFRDGFLTLPDGVRYRVLSLPAHPSISLAVLRKVRALVHAGATVVGPPPRRASGLAQMVDADAAVTALVRELWGEGDTSRVDRRVGAGRVVSGRSCDEVLLGSPVPADFAFAPNTGTGPVTFVHRRMDDADLYFVSTRSTQATDGLATFRVTGRQPEIWDAVSGERRDVAAWSSDRSTTTLRLELPPCGSRFVVFRRAGSPPATPPAPASPPQTLATVPGPWTVRFDTNWGGPSSVVLDALASWTEHTNAGVRFYSGTGVYSADMPAVRPPANARVWIDLGSVRELARVRLNGRDLGIVWAPPFRVDATAALQAKANRLEIEVVNFWPNRIIGDAALPPDQRRTRTNIRRLTATTPLMPSGLLGPVTVIAGE